ncbi:hypothetical protein GOODEAATRI_019209, partial [Goodea atripinnis]
MAFIESPPSVSVATSVFSFLQPKYTYSRQDGVANIPINREIIEDGRTQVTYCTQDLTAKNKKDYKSVQGDLSYGPGETQKIIPVPLLELNEKDGFLEDKPIKQFVMDLSNPRQGAKLGRYPRTTVTITDLTGLRSPEVAQLQSKGFISPKGKSPSGSFPAPGNLKAKATGPKNIRLNWDPPPVPGEPGRLAFNVISPTVTQLSWAEPAETNGNITAYEVIYTPIDDEMKNRGYTDENIRDSIVMGDVSNKFLDLSGFGYTGVHSSSQTQYSYSLSQGSRARTQSSEVNEALYSLDRVLHGEMKRINVTNPAENSVVIHDLLPNHSYLFKVKAQSQEGWGPEREGVITIESAVDPKSPLSPMPGDMRSFKVNGDNAETSLTVTNLTENVPYKFKVQARTTQGFGPEREGIITIESQDGGALSQYNTQSMTRREVFQMPTEVTTRTNVSHTMLNDPYFSDGTMMTQLTETGGMVSRQVTREVVQRSVMGGSTVTKRMFYES